MVSVRTSIPRPGLPEYVSLPLLGAVCLVMAGDVITTHYGLTLGLTEANPLMRPIVHEYGILGMAAMKAATILFLLGVTHVSPTPKTIFQMGSAAFLLTGVVVIIINCIAIASAL